MNILNESQIEQVLVKIREHGVRSDSLKLEVLDHICCAVEKAMDNGQSFKEALEQTVQSFGEKGLYKIDRQIKSYKRKKGIVKKLRVSTASMAACFMLLVLAVDAQERPQIKPLEKGKFRISSTFGERIDPFDNKRKFHRGVDMAVPEGTPVKATADGIIEKVVSKEGGAGKFVVIIHDDEYQTLYANLSEFRVQIGQKVKKGDVIALSGNTGKSTAPHLHYEVIRNGENVDPELYFSE